MRKATLAAVAAVLAGCGGQPQATAQTDPAPTPTATVTPTPTPAVTHREFIRALNASCAKHAKATERLARRGDAAITREDLPAAGRILRKILPYIREHTRQTSRLKPPPEDRDDFRAYVRAQRRFQGYGVRLVRALIADDYNDAVRWSDLGNDARADRATAAIDLGADKCGS